MLNNYLLIKVFFLIFCFNAYAQNKYEEPRISFSKPFECLNYIPKVKLCLNYNTDIKKEKQFFEMEPVVRRLGRRVLNDNKQSFLSGYYCFDENCILHRKSVLLTSKSILCRNQGNMRKFKRAAKTVKPKERLFVPSISSGVLADLGDFFKGLSHNVNFSENSILGKAETRLLSGIYPLHMINEEISKNGHENPLKTAEFLHAIRSYRPAQKIRSLISLSPPGYHASHFIDPNYMWVGLGK